MSGLPPNFNINNQDDVVESLLDNEMRSAQ